MTTIANGKGVVVVGQMPNGRLEGIRLETPEGSQVRLSDARKTGRYTHIGLATVFHWEAVE